MVNFSVKSLKLNSIHRISRGLAAKSFLVSKGSAKLPWLLGSRDSTHQKLMTDFHRSLQGNEFSKNLRAFF